MKTLVVLSAVAAIAIAAPALLDDIDVLAPTQNELQAAGQREKKSTLPQSEPSLDHTTNDDSSTTSQVHGNPKTTALSPATSRTHFHFKKKPIIVKNKLGYRLYRDSDEERAQADPSENCRKQFRFKLCDEGRETESNDMRASLNHDEQHMSEKGLEQNLRAAKEAVEKIQWDLEKMEHSSPKASQWKHSNSDHDTELHEEIEVARQALEQIERNFGDLEIMNLHATTIQDDDVHDFNFKMSKPEEERMAQWKEAIKNIQRNVEIAKDIEDSFKSAHVDSLTGLETPETLKKDSIDLNVNLKGRSESNIQQRESDFKDESKTVDDLKLRKPELEQNKDETEKTSKHAEEDMNMSSTQHIQSKTELQSDNLKVENAPTNTADDKYLGNSDEPINRESDNKENIFDDNLNNPQFASSATLQEKSVEHETDKTDEQKELKFIDKAEINEDHLAIAKHAAIDKDKEDNEDSASNSFIMKNVASEKENDDIGTMKSTENQQKKTENFDIHDMDTQATVEIPMKLAIPDKLVQSTDHITSMKSSDDSTQQEEQVNVINPAETNEHFKEISMPKEAKNNELNHHMRTAPVNDEFLEKSLQLSTLEDDQHKFLEQINMMRLAQEKSLPMHEMKQLKPTAEMTNKHHEFNDHLNMREAQERLALQELMQRKAASQISDEHHKLHKPLNVHWSHEKNMNHHRTMHADLLDKHHDINQRAHMRWAGRNIDTDKSMPMKHYDSNLKDEHHDINEKFNTRWAGEDTDVQKMVPMNEATDLNLKNDHERFNMRWSQGDAGIEKSIPLKNMDSHLENEKHDLQERFNMRFPSGDNFEKSIPMKVDFESDHKEPSHVDNHMHHNMHIGKFPQNFEQSNDHDFTHLAPRHHEHFVALGKPSELDAMSEPSLHMSIREPSGKSAMEFNDMMQWNPGTGRSAYGSAYPIAGVTGSTAVGLFPNANVGGCAIPLLLSCSPSVVSGSLAKPHSPAYAPAYRSGEDFKNLQKRDIKIVDEIPAILTHQTPLSHKSNINTDRKL